MSDEPNLEDEHQISTHEQIAQLEARIEELAEAVERCRKLSLFSNVLLIGGALWLFAGMAGVVYFGPAMLGAITAILGGFVLNGSNRSTMRQTQAALDTAEATRTELIGALSLRTVEADTTFGAVPTGPWLH
jgi:hypothetical protein